MISFIEQGQGQPIVFLHGMGLNAASWQYQLDAFGKDYRAIALDLPGYGDSPALAEVTFTHYAKVLDDFIRKHGLEKLILVGHSFGGMLVQEHLALYPNQIKAAVLYATSPAFGNPEGEWQQAFIRARLKPFEEGKSMPELAEKMMMNMAGSGGTGEGLELAKSAMAATRDETFKSSVWCLTTFDQRANLANIDMPTLLIVGEEDQNAPAPMMEKMASKIPSAEYVCLEKLGHLAHLENPTLFNDALASFLKGVEPL